MNGRLLTLLFIGVLSLGQLRSPGRTIYLGDSITAWDVTLPTADNKGIAGNTTDQMVERFQRDVLDQHPARVVILAGINDVGKNINTEGNLLWMIQRAHHNGIAVTVCTVLPTDRSFLGKDPNRIKEINRFIMEMPGVTRVDYWASVVGPDDFARPGLLRDGLHPNWNGYQVMANTRKGRI